jgi:hypothetical protein
MKIIFAGIIGRYPWGGVTWCSLMYLIGLRSLGHDIIYIEDTCECNYDPEQNSDAIDPSYALRHINESLSPHGFAHSWCYIDHSGKHHGISEARLVEHCREADIFIVLSGGCWIWRDHYAAIPKRVFIDSDPAFTQMALNNAEGNMSSNQSSKWYVDFFANYTDLFTFGANIGKSACPVPVGDRTWKHTWQPVCTRSWQPNPNSIPSRKVWTTVMTWKIKSFKEVGGNKDHEFLKILPLADALSTLGIDIELAINGPMDLLRTHGWRCLDAMSISSTLWSYHAYISSSRGEFSVAKKTYVETRSGWFSDRTICYLASGKPAVVQDTGFTNLLPTGKGLYAWKTMEDALEFIAEIEGNYAHHSTWARELACEHFEASRVLGAMLDKI